MISKRKNNEKRNKTKAGGGEQAEYYRSISLTYRSFRLNYRKGFTQIDYIIAIGIFVVVFALVVQIVNNYFSGLATTAEIRILTSEGNELLAMAENGFVRDGVPYAQDNDVVLYMHLDNSTLDSSKYGNNGMIINFTNCSSSVTGKVGGACEFPGNVSEKFGYINVSDSDTLDLENFTIAFWVIANESSDTPITGATTQVINKETYADAFSRANYVFSWRHAGLGFRRSIAFYDGSAWRQTQINTTLEANVWYHIVATYNMTDLSVYLNGIKNGSNEYNITPQTGTGPLSIGSGMSTSGPSSFFPGKVDEVIIWNRSLSDSEIYKLYYYENIARHTNLESNAYRFSVRVNNSPAWWKQGNPWKNLSSELVAINYTNYGLDPDIGSTTIFDDTGNYVPYEVSGKAVIFTTNIPVNATKNYTIYFDDDSNFTRQSTPQAGFDNLTEQVFGPERVMVIEQRKMELLAGSSYSFIKSFNGLPKDFRISVVDSQTGSAFAFGGTPPNAGNIVAMRRFVIFQNSTGSIRRGYLNVQTW
jgi:hypothetical protein